MKQLLQLGCGCSAESGSGALDSFATRRPPRLEGISSIQVFFRWAVALSERELKYCLRHPARPNQGLQPHGKESKSKAQGAFRPGTLRATVVALLKAWFARIELIHVLTSPGPWLRADTPSRPAEKEISLRIQP